MTRVQQTLWYFDAHSSVGKVDNTNAIFSLVFYTGKSHFCCCSQYAKLSDVCHACQFCLCIVMVKFSMIIKSGALLGHQFK